MSLEDTWIVTGKITNVASAIYAIKSPEKPLSDEKKQDKYFETSSKKKRERLIQHAKTLHSCKMSYLAIFSEGLP